jgi:hypothetical protein
MTTKRKDALMNDNNSFIENRFIDGREDSANGLVEILLENVFLFGFKKDWLFPIVPSISVELNNLLKVKSYKLTIDQISDTDKVKGNTWDHLFTRKKGRTADSLFTTQDKRSLIIVENKKSETGFYVQQLLYYYLYCLHNLASYDNFYIINTVIDHNDMKNPLKLHSENRDLMKRAFEPKKDVVQLCEIIKEAVEKLEDLILHPENNTNRELINEKIIDVFYKNLEIVKDKIKFKVPSEVKQTRCNSNVGKLTIKRDNKLFVEWVIIPWSAIQWNKMADSIKSIEAQGTKVNNGDWKDIIQKELFLLDSYYHS